MRSATAIRLNPRTSVLALACLFAAPSARAAEEHLYDPALSLTGSTATSSEDPVPDPGPDHPPKSFIISF